MSDNPYEAPRTAGQPPLPLPRRKWGLLKVLAVVGLLGFVVILLLPTTRSARPAARRMVCGNNLKQIGLALHNYADANGGVFPPAYTVDAEGRPLHSWRTLILPYMEEGELYKKIDLTKPWDDPANKEAYAAMPRAYRCPSTNCPPGQTTYLAIVAPGSCLQPSEPRSLSEFADGTSLTLVALDVDAAHAVHWMSPKDASEEWLVNLKTASKLPHSIVMALLADGSVRGINRNTDVAELRALISIAGDDNANVHGAR